MTFVITVADSSGKPIGGVLVTLQGPASRQQRTERGRIVFEGLPAGNYRLRFEHPDFQTLEREVTGRGRKPIDVDVQLTAAPKAAPPPPPVAPPPPPKADAMALDLTSFIERNYIGKAPSKTSAVACASGGSAVLVQVREPLKEDATPDADRFLYVIAGTGNAHIATQDEPLGAGTFVMIPRGLSDELSARGRNPLVVLSVKAGGSCAPEQARR